MCGQTLPFIVIANCAIQQQYNTIQYDVPGISMTHRDSWLQCRDRDPTTASRELQTATHITYSLLIFIAVVPRQISRLLLNWPMGHSIWNWPQPSGWPFSICLKLYWDVEMIKCCIKMEADGWCTFKSLEFLTLNLNTFKDFSRPLWILLTRFFPAEWTVKGCFSPRDKTQSAVFCDKQIKVSQLKV